VVVDLLFGQFVRNVPVDHADFLQPSTQFELASPNLMARRPRPVRVRARQLVRHALDRAAADRQGDHHGRLVGTNTTDPATVRALNAATAKIGGQVEAFGTASDIARLRVRRSTRPA
jgi:hypothetical protein